MSEQEATIDYGPPKAYNDRILIQYPIPKTKTDAGIILPNGVQSEMPKNGFEVLSVGPSVDDIAVGDRVFFKDYLLQYIGQAGTKAVMNEAAAYIDRENGIVSVDKKQVTAIIPRKR